jgi:hypothetical protein
MAYDGLEHGGRCGIKLCYVLTLLTLGSSLFRADGWAQRKGSRTSPKVLTMQSQSSGSVSAELSSTADGAAVALGPSGRQALDLGTVSYGTGARAANVQISKRADGFVVTTKFGLTIQDTSQRFSTAVVMASVAFADNIYGISVDGVRLATTPQVIQAQARVGPAQQHRLEIHVPASATEKNAQLHTLIVFQVVPN